MRFPIVTGVGLPRGAGKRTRKKKKASAPCPCAFYRVLGGASFFSSKKKEMQRCILRRGLRFEKIWFGEAFPQKQIFLPPAPVAAIKKLLRQARGNGPVLFFRGPATFGTFSAERSEGTGGILRDATPSHFVSAFAGISALLLETGLNAFGFSGAKGA